MSRSTDILATYVSDCLALEKHLFEAFDRQAKDGAVQPFQQAGPLLNHLRQIAKDHAGALDAHLRGLGGQTTSPVKEAITSALGMAAGILDKVRTYSVSKM